jgi:hypothetical protein
VRHPIAPGAARWRRPPLQFPGVRAVKLQRVLGRLDDRGEYRPAPLAVDDAQHRPVALGAYLQHRQQARRQRRGVKTAAVGPPQQHLIEEPPFKLGWSCPPTPAHPRDQQWPTRVGQDRSLRNEAE